tara:strand:+ start:922 stop:1977 length:1056 start_codon:yes stop_codon:yes gene_type:complete
LNVVKNLDKNYFEPHICCSHDRGKLFQVVLKTGIPIHLHRTTHDMIPRIAGIKKCFNTAKYFKSLGINIIHSFHYGADYSEAIAAKISGIPWIYTKKNMNWGGSSKNGWKTRTYLASHIMVQNTDMIKRFFPKSNKISLVPRGVDTSDFKKRSKNSKIMNHLQIDGKEIVILCVANLHPVKGVEILLHAFDKLFEQDNHCRLLIVGDNDNDYGRELINISRKLISVSKIEFIGQVFNVKGYYSISDIFVLPTLDVGRVEGSPVSLLEGLSCRKKVLASNVPGIKDILSNFPDCLFKPGDVDDLYNKLNDLLYNIRNKINNNNKVSQYIRKNYDISVESKRHESVYKRFFKD